jgi:NAD+ synthetase
MNNYKEIFNTMIDETARYLIDNNLKAIVLGISGGIDSTVTAAICSEVEKRNPELKFYGVSLPCTSNTIDENNSATICMKAFCKEGNYWIENLQKEYMLMKGTCELHGDSTYISQGNVKARLRMIYLYNLASINQGLVMDTDNLTEHYLGFFTIHGDVADFNPIGGLWKHEIYELANWLRDHYDKFTKYVSPDSFDIKDEIDTRNEYARKVKALSYALNIIPTDGNGVNDLGDMGQIAPQFAHDNNYEAYTKVDNIIKTYINFIGRHPEEFQAAMEALYTEYGFDTVNGVINRIKKTEYKRKGLPIVIPRKNYNLE